MMRSMQSRLWVKILVFPLLVNAGLWLVALLPAQAWLERLRGALAAADLKPSLESSLGESDQILNAWKQRPSWEGDSYAPKETLQRLALSQHIQVVSMKANPSTGQSAVGDRTVDLEADCTGPFNKLARWIRNIEEDDRFRIDSWEFRAGENAEQPTRLSVKMTAFIR